jgi:hypothetical protein
MIGELQAWEVWMRINRLIVVASVALLATSWPAVARDRASMEKWCDNRLNENIDRCVDRYLVNDPNSSAGWSCVNQAVDSFRHCMVSAQFVEMQTIGPD